MAFRRGTGGPRNITLPTITGIGQVGQTLTANPGTWTGSPTFAYQWTRDDLTVLSTATTYAAGTADFGHFLILNVTATQNGKSTTASSLLPTYSMFSTNLGGTNVKLLYSLATQECNHGHQNVTGTHVAFSVYNLYSGGTATEGVSYLGTEVRSVRLSDGLVEVLVPPNMNYNNSNPAWFPVSPDQGSFVYASTNMPSGKGGMAKYDTGTHTSSVYYDPGTPKIADFDIGSDGTMIMGADAVVSGVTMGCIFIRSAAGVLSQLTAPFTAQNFNPRGNADPHLSHNLTKASCIRALDPQIFKIIIITFGAGYTNASESIIAPFGSATAFYGVPEWSSDDALIVAWYTDNQNRADDGIYYQTPTGTGRTRIPLPVGYKWNTVSFIPGGGSSASAGIIVSGQPLPIFPQVPTNTVLPAISGTAQVGQVLTSTDGTWTSLGTPSYSRQWKSAGVNATGAGATTSTYTCASADIGNTMTCVIIAINSGGFSTPATSAATAAVIP